MLSTGSGLYPEPCSASPASSPHPDYAISSPFIRPQYPPCPFLGKLISLLFPPSNLSLNVTSSLIPKLSQPCASFAMLQKLMGSQIVRVANHASLHEARPILSL